MLDTVSNQNSVEGLMLDIGRRARAAARPLAIASTEAKNKALLAMADALVSAEADILAANAIDLKNAAEAGVAASFIDRLTLNSARVAAIAQSMREIAELQDPVGSIIAEWDRPNGLHIERVRTPLGVIGVIYESRPNVTADAASASQRAAAALRSPMISRSRPAAIGSQTSTLRMGQSACMGQLTQRSHASSAERPMIVAKA